MRPYNKVYWSTTLVRVFGGTEVLGYLYVFLVTWTWITWSCGSLFVEANGPSFLDIFNGEQARVCCSASCPQKEHPDMAEERFFARWLCALWHLWFFKCGCLWIIRGSHTLWTTLSSYRMVSRKNTEGILNQGPPWRTGVIFDFSNAVLCLLDSYRNVKVLTHFFISALVLLSKVEQEKAKVLPLRNLDLHPTGNFQW